MIFAIFTISFRDYQLGERLKLDFTLGINYIWFYFGPLENHHYASIFLIHLFRE
jgi:hypothetical protein